MTDLSPDEVLTVMRVSGPNESIFIASPTGKRSLGVRSDRFYGKRRINEPFDIAKDDYREYQRRFPGYLQPVDVPRPPEFKAPTVIPQAPVRLDQPVPAAIQSQETKPPEMPRFTLRRVDPDPIEEPPEDEPLLLDDEPAEPAELMTISELAEHFQVSESTVRNRIRDNEIEPEEIAGRTPYFSVAEIAVVI